MEKCQIKIVAAQSSKASINNPDVNETVCSAVAPKMKSPTSTSSLSDTSAVKSHHHEKYTINNPKAVPFKLSQPSLAQLVQANHISIAGGIDQHSRPLLVLKVGTSSILETETASFCLSNLGKFVDCVCHIKEQGYQVVLVSSGAVGAGVIHMKLRERPTTLPEKQAASAVGQCRMMRLYEDLFAIREEKVGQIILTRTDLMDRTRFINFKQALKELLRLGVVPIINENDSIATAQLRFGDNDTLAAYVAISLGAQWLFLLTDVDCLFTANPRLHPNAKPIPYVGHLDDVYKLLDEKENTGTSWGSGGMRTKIVAAKIATATGIHTALCHGKHPERVLDVIAFAEAHGQTPMEWEEELARWRGRSECHSKSTNMTSSKSEASFQGGRRHLGRGSIIHASCSDFRGLQHHHHHNLLCPLLSPQPATVGNSSGRMKETANEDGPQINGPASITGDSYPEQGIINHCGLITVDSLSDMPYLATIFAAQECKQSIKDQRRWILSLPVRGRIYIDQGAARAIIEGKKSLFAAGIIRIEGVFYENEATALMVDKLASAPLSPLLPTSTAVSEPSSSPGPPARVTENITVPKIALLNDGNAMGFAQPAYHPPGGGHLHSYVHPGGEHKSRHRSPIGTEPSLSPLHIPNTLATPVEAPEQEGELARCLVNFTSHELQKIKGLRSDKFRDILGYECEPEVAHRQNIIFVNPCIVYGCAISSADCSHPSA